MAVLLQETVSNGVTATNQNGAIAPGSNAVMEVMEVARGSGSNGKSGQAPGGGGGGGGKGKDGGTGGNGKINITWTCPTYSLHNIHCIANLATNLANISVKSNESIITSRNLHSHPQLNRRKYRNRKYGSNEILTSNISANNYRKHNCS
jgi:hypothetical protein